MGHCSLQSTVVCLHSRGLMLPCGLQGKPTWFQVVAFGSIQSRTSSG